MDEVVPKIRVLVTISYVKITCYDYHIVQINNILVQEIQSSLIAIRINVDYEVSAIVVIEGQNIDVMVIDNIKA